MPSANTSNKKATTRISKFLEVNKIHQGDAPSLLREIEADSVALSIWSPPYFVGKDYEKHLTFESWKELLAETVSEHTRIIKPGGFLVVNISDILAFPDESIPRIQAANVSLQRCKVTKEDVVAAIERFPNFNRNQLAEYLKCSEQTIDRRLNGNNIRGGKYMTQTRVQLVGDFINGPAYDAGLYLYDRRVWVKDPTWATNQWHSSSYRSVNEFEDLYVFWKPGETKVDRKRISKGEWSEWGSRQVWEFPSVRSNRDHEAQFPIELPTRFIRLLTEKADVVLDCFMGSGTTALAAIQNQRQFIGIELQEKYVKLAQKRIKKLSEQDQARLF